MSVYDEETRGLLNNTVKRRKSQKFLIVVAIVLVISSVGVIISHLHEGPSSSGTITIYPTFFLYMTKLMNDDLSHKKDHSKPHLVIGTQGGVAVELQECSNAGLESKICASFSD